MLLDTGTGTVIILLMIILLSLLFFIIYLIQYPLSLSLPPLSSSSSSSPKHVAIIMDGNGRWAKERSLPRNLGHYKGILNILNIAKEAIDNNIKVLSLYAFSIQNWSRPKKEIDFIFNLIRIFNNKIVPTLLFLNIKIVFKGNYEFLTPSLLHIIDTIHNRSKNNTGLLLRIYVSYDGQYEILEAVNRCSSHTTLEQFDKLVDDAPPLDLLIRTSGEKRISNFMLWQIAYAELYFTPLHWPDFNSREFQIAIADFSSRKRRFGKLDTPAHIFPYIFENLLNTIRDITDITDTTNKDIPLTTATLERRIQNINIQSFADAPSYRKLSDKWLQLALTLFKLEYKYALFSSNTELIKEIISTQVNNIYNLSFILHKYLPDFAVNNIKSVYHRLEDIHIETLKKINYFLGIARNKSTVAQDVCVLLFLLYPLFTKNNIEINKADIHYFSYLAKGISSWMNNDYDLTMYFINYWLSLPVPQNMKKYEKTINSIIDLTLCIIINRLSSKLQTHYSNDVKKFAYSLNYEKIYTLFSRIIS